MVNTKFIYTTLVLLVFVFMTSCGGDAEKTDAKGAQTTAKKAKPKSMMAAEVDPMDDVGIGPIKELTLPASIDDEMAAAGKVVYKAKCTACHKASKKFIGPSPTGIFERRNPAWVMNMILNPEEMVQKNKIAKALLIEYNGSPMANQNLTEEEARSVLEYFRTLK